ncbi:hypothetical protein [Paenibacillus sp. MMO-58]|uniref:hypothetical protein n=1 Tax=Paenibacillus sp. MMO-58 TaxID=3081290 RepID=UPI0030176ECD
MSDQKPMVPTKEELELIRNYCIVPLMMKMIQKNRTDMEYSDNTLKTLYMWAADRLWEKLEQDKRRFKAELKRIDCKVQESKRHDDSSAVYFEFWLRGYHDEFGIMKFLVVSEMSIRLGGYIARVTKDYKPSLNYD